MQRHRDIKAALSSQEVLGAFSRAFQCACLREKRVVALGAFDKTPVTNMQAVHATCRRFAQLKSP